MITPFIGVSAGFALFLGHGIVHLKDLGHSMQVGAWAVGTMTISGLIAKGGHRGARRPRRSAIPVGDLLCHLRRRDADPDRRARVAAAVSAAAVCLGIGFGGGIVAMMATLSNYYGTRVFASLSGLAIAINTGISSLAPIIAGRMYDQGLGYTAAFCVIAAWCIAGGVMLALMKRPQRAAAMSPATIPGSGV